MLNHKSRKGWRGKEREPKMVRERERKRRELGRKEGWIVRGRQTDLAGSPG